MQLHWLEQSAGDVVGSENWLSAGERLRLTQVKVPKRRDDWRLGRWTAKLAVAGYLRLPSDPAALSSIEIRPHASGAPEAFVNNEPAGASLSLSHSSGVAICAVASAGVPLGCDLEAIEPRSQAFVTDYFTGEEQEMILHSPPAIRDLLVTVIWSAKESALKALRTGLRLDTRSVSASLDSISSIPPITPEVGIWAPLSVRYGDQVFPGWWVNVDGLVRTIVSIPAAEAPLSARFAVASAK